MNRYRIDEITDWDVNRPFVQANARPGGEDYNAVYAEACSVRDEMRKVGGRDLPFECDAENEDEALAKYAAKYADELVVPTDAIITQLRRFVVSLQVDTRKEVEVYNSERENPNPLGLG